MPNKFWKIKNISNSDAVLMLYGEIASDRPWWDFDKEENFIIPTEFNQAMQTLNGKSKITVRLNSNGGDPWAATAIYTMLLENQAQKEIIVEGLAASAATIILCAAQHPGDVVRAPSNAGIMIHLPEIYPNGASLSEDDLAKMQNALQTVKESLLNAYVQKSNKTRDELLQMMKAEEWMTGEQAKEAGFVDEIMTEKANIQASADGKYIFSNKIKMNIGALKAIPNIQILKNESEEENSMEEIKDSAELQKTYPELTKALADTAVKDALAKERKRMQDIDAISANISPELVAKAKYEEPVSAADLALQALKNDKALASNYLDKAQDDVKNSGAEDVGSAEGKNPAAPAAKTKNKVSAFARAAMRLDRSTRNEEE